MSVCVYMFNSVYVCLQVLKGEEIGIPDRKMKPNEDISDNKMFCVCRRVCFWCVGVSVLGVCVCVHVLSLCGFILDPSL